ncbi:MAG: PmoA family protein [Chloroflexi bacterium]|nr:PmoA family protein [Chloroflexota bacterium]
MEATLDVGRQLAIRHAGHLLAIYHFGAEDAKPFFHPVTLGNGNASSLTLASPHDHLHHRGLWFCWKFVNGQNFWEEQPVRHLVRTRRLEVELTTAEQVRWTAELDWQLATGETVLREQRVLTVRQPWGGPSRHRYAIDFDLTFRPVLPEIHLALLTVQEQSWGGYAGLGYRPARGMDVKGQLLTSNGPATSADKGVPARWADYSGGLNGSPQVGGIAIFDHPENVRHPPPFFVLSPPAFGFLNPSPLFHDGLRLLDGEVLRLRYRALVHAGLGEREDLDTEFRSWSAGEEEGVR